MTPPVAAESTIRRNRCKSASLPICGRRVNLLPGAVVANFAADVGLLDIGSVVERRSVENQQVGVLAFFNAAEPIRQAENAGRGNGQRFQRRLFAAAAADRESRLQRKAGQIASR